MAGGAKYWVNLFTLSTWEESLKAGGSIAGFREKRWSTVKKIAPGDFLLCYITGISRFVGVQKAISKPERKTDPIQIWGLDEFPCRVEVETVARLTPETGVPVTDLRDRLSIFRDLKSPHAWSVHFRASPGKMTPEDGEAIVAPIREAEKYPVQKPFDPAKYRKRVETVETSQGAVVVPDGREQTNEAEEPDKAITVHTEVQYLLLKLGNDMAYDVWVARNDKGKECFGTKLSEMRGIQSKLPLQFDEATNKTIELIDVLWLSKNAIVAAFEIESTTSIYSGLLRMSDLVSMQPNLNIPLYIVAPDERRDKVIAEINRPTFAGLEQPLSFICRYIPFSSLKAFVDKHSSVLIHLKPDVIASDEVSESCEIDQV